MTDLKKTRRGLMCYSGGMIDPATFKENRDATGAVPELVEIVGAELLDEVKQAVQRVWIRVYGLELIRTELPFLFARWMTDEQRSASGALPLFMNSWFKNRKEQEQAIATKPAPTPTSFGKLRYRNTGEPCNRAFYDGKPIGCSVHASNEVCEIDGRKN